MPNLFTRERRVIPESSGGTCGSADDSVRILGKRGNKDPEFQKEYLSCPLRCKNSSEKFRAIQTSSRFSKQNQRRMYDCKTPQFQHMIPNSFEIAIIIAY
jgi:hypothetical protein